MKRIAAVYNKTKPLTIMVAGGGTAGHIEPAMAVADAINELSRLSLKEGDCTPHVRIIALGTAKGLDSVLIPARGYQIEYTDPIPLPRSWNRELITLPWRIIRSVIKTYRIIHRYNVSIIIGFGGYVALSAYIASIFPPRVPVFIHEANARVGLANKLGEKIARRVYATYPASGFARVPQVIGTPIRSTIAQLHRESVRESAREKLGIPLHGKAVLVFGGSQGAQRINDALKEAIPQILAKNIHIVHAYGKKNTPIMLVDDANIAEKTPDQGVYIGLPYIERMDYAYAACDLVVARSGAMTVAELSSVGLPAIYIPLGHGNGEQALNAAPAVKAQAAIIIDESQLTGENLQEKILAILLSDHSVCAQGAHLSSEQQLTLESTLYDHMLNCAKQLSPTNAAHTLARHVWEFLT